MRSGHLKTGWVWVLGGGLALNFSGLAMGQETETQEKPAVKENGTQKDVLFPFTVSKETTRITEPLNADGTVDYAAAINARNSQGLKPEDNAGVLLMQVFGRDAVPEANRERFYKALGIAVPNRSEGMHTDLGQLIKQHLKDKGEDSESADAFSPFWDQQGHATSRPWSRREFPIVAQWVDANADALKLAVEASKKPRLFFPMVVAEKHSLLDLNLETVQQMRELARLLTARAMLALEEGRVEEAQQDLMACHRLASLLGHRSTMIEAFVSYALDAVACRADLAMAQSEKVTQAQLSAYRQQLLALSPLPKMSDNIDQGERFFSLDAICQLATQKMDGNDLGFPNSALFKRMMGLSIDWDLILKRFNTEYDQMATSLSLPSFAERQAAIDEMDAKLKKLKADASHPAKIAMMAFAPRSAVSQQMSDTLLLLLLPAVSQSSHAETRSLTRRDQTIIAFALAEYQREHGKYPETLSDLSPKFLKTLPQDAFTGQPLKYKLQDQGYLLYSQGPNGKDDQGQDRNAENDADDFATRVPTPPEL